MERAAQCKVHGHCAVSCAKTAEPIEMPFGLWSQMGPCVTWGAYWRNLANTTEPSVCYGDVAFLSNYFDHLLLLLLLYGMEKIDDVYTLSFASIMHGLLDARSPTISAWLQMAAT